LSSIARENQMIKNILIKAFAIRQFDDSITFNFFILNNKYYVFRFVFASIFFNIFLLRSNRVITIINMISFFITLENKSFLIQFKEIHNIFIYDLFAQTHFEHFK